MQTYNWYNMKTGEVVCGFKNVVKTFITDFLHYKLIGHWVRR